MFGNWMVIHMMCLMHKVKMCRHREEIPPMAELGGCREKILFDLCLSNI